MISRLITLCALLALAMPAAAQDKPMARPRPVQITIEKIEKDSLTGKLADGTERTFVLPADLRVTNSHMATFADVKAGQFIGCTAVEGPDGKLHAKEIHVIPEAMRGAGEGHYPWGDTPKTTMTNGNVEKAAGVANGGSISVSYKGGTTDIAVPPTTKVTVIEVATLQALKPEMQVGLYASADSSGTWTAHFISLAPLPGQN